MTKELDSALAGALASLGTWAVGLHYCTVISPFNGHIATDLTFPSVIDFTGAFMFCRVYKMHEPLRSINGKVLKAGSSIKQLNCCWKLLLQLELRPLHQQAWPPQGPSWLD
jgi:hypothetical protein